MSPRDQDTKKVWIGAVLGVVLVALCCFTPLLVTVLALVGLSALTPYLDYMLFPALVVLVIVAVMSYRKWRQSTHEHPTHTE